MKQARYISLEGVDGAGKSSQLKLLVQAFEQAGIPHVTTREPGGTQVGNEIRQILLTGHDTKLSGVSEALLLSAARHELVRQVITPSLNDGTWVISDRTFMTMMVFQGVGRGMDVPTLEMLTDFAIGDCRPDLQVVLDVPVEKGLLRKKPQIALGLTETRFENVEMGFHYRNRQGYLDYVASHPDTCVLVDADATIEEVHARIIAVVNERLGLDLEVQHLHHDEQAKV